MIGINVAVEARAPVAEHSSRVPDERVAHLVLPERWPTALCGATVKEMLDPSGRQAPGRDRCTVCLGLARDARNRRGLP